MVPLKTSRSIGLAGCCKFEHIFARPYISSSIWINIDSFFSIHVCIILQILIHFWISNELSWRLSKKISSIKNKIERLNNSILTFVALRALASVAVLVQAGDFALASIEVSSSNVSEYHSSKQLISFCLRESIACWLNLSSLFESLSSLKAALQFFLSSLSSLR